MSDGLTFSRAEYEAMLKRTGLSFVGTIDGEWVDTCNVLRRAADEMINALSPNKYGLAPNGRRYKSKTEASYAEYLEIQKRTGAIRWWGYECLTLTLGADVRYTPDFIVGYAPTPTALIEAHEVKGGNYWRREGKTKFRIAPPMYPWLKFVGVAYVEGRFRQVEVHNA